jgi:hypothetical protein
MERRDEMIDLIVTQRVDQGMEQSFEAIVRELATNTLAQDEEVPEIRMVSRGSAAYVCLDRAMDGIGSSAGSSLSRSHRSVDAKVSSMRSRGFFRGATHAIGLKILVGTFWHGRGEIYVRTVSKAEAVFRGRQTGFDL